jgi:hypothetical protein
MSQARRSTGATCWVRPRHRRLTALKCRRCAGRKQRGATRLWTRAHVRRPPLPEWTSGRSAPVRHPTGRALPSRRDVCPVKPTLQVGRRSGRRLPASSMTAQTDLTLSPFWGTGLGGDRRTRRRCRVRCWQWSQAPLRGACSHCSSGAEEPRTFMCPSSPAGGGGHGPTPVAVDARGTAPERTGESVTAVEAAGRSGAAPETHSPRAGLEARGPREGHVGPPGEEARVSSKM